MRNRKADSHRWHRNLKSNALLFVSVVSFIIVMAFIIVIAPSIIFLSKGHETFPGTISNTLDLLVLESYLLMFFVLVVNVFANRSLGEELSFKLIFTLPIYTTYLILDNEFLSICMNKIIQDSELSQIAGKLIVTFIVYTRLMLVYPVQGSRRTYNERIRVLFQDIGKIFCLFVNAPKIAYFSAKTVEEGLVDETKRFVKKHFSKGEFSRLLQVVSGSRPIEEYISRNKINKLGEKTGVSYEWYADLSGFDEKMASISKFFSLVLKDFEESFLVLKESALFNQNAYEMVVVRGVEIQGWLEGTN